MLDGGWTASGRRSLLSDLRTVAAAILAWVLVPAFAGRYFFTRGDPVEQAAAVALLCQECNEEQPYPELPASNDEAAWICKNVRRHAEGEQRERVWYYLD
jgi:hypothetical protein